MFSQRYGCHIPSPIRLISLYLSSKPSNELRKRHMSSATCSSTSSSSSLEFSAWLWGDPATEVDSSSVSCTSDAMVWSLSSSDVSSCMGISPSLTAAVLGRGILEVFVAGSKAKRREKGSWIVNMKRVWSRGEFRCVWRFGDLAIWRFGGTRRI
jgi:hypothetical protein